MQFTRARHNTMSDQRQPAVPLRPIPNEDEPGFAQVANRQLTTYPNWETLRWLLLFRLLTVVGLVMAFVPSAIELAATHQARSMIWDWLVLYAFSVLLGGFGLITRWPKPSNQVQLAIFSDLIFYTLLMHMAGGIGSGIGVIMGLAVATGAVVLESRLSLVFAALASLAVIGQQTYASLASLPQRIDFTHAGMLGLLFFAIAIFSQLLYRRIRQAEELALRRSVDLENLSYLNDFIVRSMDTGIVAVDGQRRVRLLNQAACELLGIESEWHEAALAEISPALAHWIDCHARRPPLEPSLLKIGERELRPTLSLFGRQRDGGLIVYLRDQQDIAREAQQIKLASLGTLTASIAHNIRNPLSSIGHAAQLLDEDQTLHTDQRHLLDIVQRNCARIEETVQSVLQISRSGQLETCHLELTEWLYGFVREFRETHQLAERDLTLNVDISASHTDVDPRHLHQIIANLCENALIHGHLPNQPTRLEIHCTSVGDNDIALDVRDHGPGIDERIAADIFNPFFTTSSQGTGLGLYIARELANINHIGLSYHTVAESGCRFRLLLKAG